MVFFIITFSHVQFATVELPQDRPYVGQVRNLLVPGQLVCLNYKMLTVYKLYIYTNNSILIVFYSYKFLGEIDIVDDKKGYFSCENICNR